MCILYDMSPLVKSDRQETICFTTLIIRLYYDLWFIRCFLGCLSGYIFISKEIAFFQTFTSSLLVLYNNETILDCVVVQMFLKHVGYLLILYSLRIWHLLVPDSVTCYWMKVHQNSR